MTFTTMKVRSTILKYKMTESMAFWRAG